MKMLPFEQSWLVIVRIESYPSLSGSLTMKSSAIVSKGSEFGSGVIGLSGGHSLVVFGLLS